MRAATWIFLLVMLTACGPAVVGRAPTVTGSAAIVQVPLRLSNVFLIQTRVPILVDSGTIGDMDDLADALAAYGVATSSLGLVIVTHGHADHAGLAAEIQKLGAAQIVLGAGDLALAAAGHNDDLKPTGFTGAVLKPFITSVYPELVPDVVVRDDAIDLAPWGIQGKVVAMPGHTPGSIVVLLDDHTAFVGDMIAGGSLGGLLSPHSPCEHLYQADPAQNRKNVKTLLDLGVTKFYLGHGGPVLRADVMRALGF